MFIESYQTKRGQQKVMSKAIEIVNASAHLINHVDGTCMHPIKL